MSGQRSASILIVAPQVEVARVKIRDRGAAGDGERIRFSSAILPLWARLTRSLDALLLQQPGPNCDFAGDPLERP